MNVITRSEARDQGLKYYFTGKQCKHGHVDYRHVHNGYCTGCDDERKKRGNRTEEFRMRARKFTPHEVKLYIIRNPHLKTSVIARRVNRKLSTVYDAFASLNIPRRARPEHYVG